MSCEIARSPRDDAFIKDMLGLGQHYDGAIGYTQFIGGAYQFSGFNIMKVRELEAVAERYGKRFTYDSNAMHIVAVDDVDGPPITPVSPEHFFTTLYGKPEFTRGPGGGAVQELSCVARQATSQILRNVLASKKALDVWIKKQKITVWAIPQSQITNGLFSQAQKAAPKLPKRRSWTAVRPVHRAGKMKGRSRAYKRLRAARQDQLLQRRRPKSSSSN